MTIDRAKLEHALAVMRVVDRQGWSAETFQAVYDAAVAHLATLPRTVTVTRWLVVSKRGEWGPMADKRDADCVQRGNPGSQIVTLSGEYEEPA